MTLESSSKKDHEGAKLSVALIGTSSLETPALRLATWQAGCSATVIISLGRADLDLDQRHHFMTLISFSLTFLKEKYVHERLRILYTELAPL